MASVLLLASAVGAVCHHSAAEPAAENLHISTFFASEGHARRAATTAQLRLRSARKANQLIVRPRGPVYRVTATAYQAVEAQTDDEPFVTADNSFIKPSYSSKLRWLAVSQDLLAHWGGRIRYGDQVHVQGISPELDGIYTVHDTMNRRHHHCIDILSHPQEKLDIFAKGVKLQLVDVQLVTRPLLAASRNANRPARLARGQRAGRQATVLPDYLTASIL